MISFENKILWTILLSILYPKTPEKYFSYYFEPLQGKILTNSPHLLYSETVSRIISLNLNKVHFFNGSAIGL
jgi:hypothetical protein